MTEIGAYQVGPSVGAYQSSVQTQTVYTLDCDSGVYTIIGQPVQFSPEKRINAEPGSYDITGKPMVFGITPAARQGTIVYLFTITGDGDGLDDMRVPITYFQARLRSGDPTYLKVVTPYTPKNAVDITARINGTMQIDLAYATGGDYTDQETIIQTKLEDIRIDEGPLNKSISLTGHRQKTYTAKSITIREPIYRNMINGKMRYRFAEPSLHLYPGDTVVVGDNTFVASTITYSVSARTGGVETSMEIAEA